MEQNFSRRSLIQLGVGFVGTGTLSTLLGTEALAHNIEQPTTSIRSTPLLTADSPAASSSAPKEELTPDEALKKLMAGNKRFVASKRENPHQDFVRVAEVATGQAPFAAILSCADSRVVPEIVFDQGLGDLFVVRVAGNLANMEDIASEEFAVGVLKAPLLMVMGHERCGAVSAALKGGEFPGVIESLVLAIQPAIKASEGETGDRLTNAVKANVRLQVQHLQNSSVISAAVKTRKLKVVGAYYDLDTGEISMVS